MNNLFHSTDLHNKEHWGGTMNPCLNLIPPAVFELTGLGVRVSVTQCLPYVTWCHFHYISSDTIKMKPNSQRFSIHTTQMTVSPSVYQLQLQCSTSMLLKPACEGSFQSFLPRCLAHTLPSGIVTICIQFCFSHPQVNTCCISERFIFQRGIYRLLHFNSI